MFTTVKLDKKHVLVKLLKMEDNKIGTLWMQFSSDSEEEKVKQGYNDVYQAFNELVDIRRQLDLKILHTGENITSLEESTQFLELFYKYHMAASELRLLCTYGHGYPVL